MCFDIETLSFPVSGLDIILHNVDLGQGHAYQERLADLLPCVRSTLEFSEFYIFMRQCCAQAIKDYKWNNLCHCALLLVMVLTTSTDYRQGQLEIVPMKGCMKRWWTSAQVQPPLYTHSYTFCFSHTAQHTHWQSNRVTLTDTVTNPITFQVVTISDTITHPNTHTYTHNIHM